MCPSTAVNTVIDVVLAERDAIRSTLLVLFHERAANGGQNGPKRLVDAYCARRRCVIDVKLCVRDGGDTSTAVLGLDYWDMQHSLCGAL